MTYIPNPDHTYYSGVPASEVPLTLWEKPVSGYAQQELLDELDMALDAGSRTAMFSAGEHEKILSRIRVIERELDRRAAEQK